ncbi:MAG: hypothetical protein RSD43_02215 [Anaerovoracaceae bacterium]
MTDKLLVLVESCFLKKTRTAKARSKKNGATVEFENIIPPISRVARSI